MWFGTNVVQYQTQSTFLDWKYLFRPRIGVLEQTNRVPKPNRINSKGVVCIGLMASCCFPWWPEPNGFVIFLLWLFCHKTETCSFFLQTTWYFKWDYFNKSKLDDYFWQQKVCWNLCTNRIAFRAFSGPSGLVIFKSPTLSISRWDI